MEAGTVVTTPTVTFSSPSFLILLHEGYAIEKGDLGQLWGQETAYQLQALLGKSISVLLSQSCQTSWGLYVLTRLLLWHLIWRCSSPNWLRSWKGSMSLKTGTSGRKIINTLVQQEQVRLRMSSWARSLQWVGRAPFFTTEHAILLSPWDSWTVDAGGAHYPLPHYDCEYSCFPETCTHTASSLQIVLEPHAMQGVLFIM